MLNVLQRRDESSCQQVVVAGHGGWVTEGRKSNVKKQSRARRATQSLDKQLEFDQAGRQRNPGLLGFMQTTCTLEACKASILMPDRSLQPGIMWLRTVDWAPLQLTSGLLMSLQAMRYTARRKLSAKSSTRPSTCVQVQVSIHGLAWARMDLGCCLGSSDMLLVRSMVHAYRS